MQIFLFTPLIIIPLAIKPILGLIGMFQLPVCIHHCSSSVAAVIFTMSTATNIFLVYHFHWPVRLISENSMNIGHGSGRSELVSSQRSGRDKYDVSEFFFTIQYSNNSNYNILMYDSPMIRCQVFALFITILPYHQIYIMGMLVGWFIQTKKKLNIHPVLLSSSSNR